MDKDALIAQLEKLLPHAKREGLDAASEFLKKLLRDAKKRHGLEVETVADAALMDAGVVEMKEASWTTIESKGGIWGLRIESLDVKPGEVVHTKTRGGKRERRAVEEVVWQGHGRTLATCRELTPEEKKTFKAPKSPRKEPTQDEPVRGPEDDLPY